VQDEAWSHRRSTGRLVGALLPSDPMDDDAFRDWLERYERAWR
jgi:hypothetical protein